jgi:phosphate transport system substrate-binding protein
MQIYRLGIRSVLAVAVLLCGCGKSSDDTAVSKKKEPSQVRIRISGAWALYPMVVKWGEAYQKSHPNVRLDISAGGAGKGVTDALTGMVELGMVSRQIKSEEEKSGIVAVPVVKDAVFLTANAGNPAVKPILTRGVKRDALKEIFADGKSMTWGELSGSESATPVNVYTRSDACGAAETWAKYLGVTQPDLKGTAVYGDPGLAEAVRKDASGLGYNNLGFAYSAATGQPIEGLVILPLDANGNGKVDPEEDVSTRAKAILAIQSGKYPSPPARDLYLVAKGKFSGASLEFVRWLLTDGQKFVDEAGYVRLSEKQIADALASLR